MPTLDALLKSSIAVEAVVTNPDRPAGRGMSPAASPVKARAQEAGIEVLQPRGGRDPALAERLRAQPPEVATVVAYGHILPGHLLEIPPLGFVNLHFSLLPRYRGAAPVQRAIMEGATSTGVSIILLTPGMDEGPVLASRGEEIRPRDTTGSLGERLALAGPTWSRPPSWVMRRGPSSPQRRRRQRRRTPRRSGRRKRVSIGLTRPRTCTTW
ncbi:MAG TPA: methionyl-tRNA formyltransferase [Actinomycetota bacterium]|nr:methionyl-tRNA formyltransferase [Actinomycetota bacterium]